MYIDLLRGRSIHDGVRRVSGLCREPVVSVKNPTLIQHPTEKDDPIPVVADSDPLVASSVRVFDLCTELATKVLRFLSTEDPEYDRFVIPIRSR